MNSIHLRVITSASLLATLMFCSCSDWVDDIDDPEPELPAQDIGITFSGNVSTAPGFTRADGSIVNLNETSLRPSTPHTYYRADASGYVNPKGVEATFYAGIFGCYTGQYKWSELVKMAKSKPEDNTQQDGEVDGTQQDGEGGDTTQEQDILSSHYTANLFFNQKANILERNEEGVNALTYTPQHFWPNNKLTADDSQHEYVTFWAYYPYNPTSSMGQYGITTNTSKGQGMGRVSFTMHPDASQQVDFMMSAPIVDCNRDKYPLISTNENQYTPKPVPFKFNHMLAQVRIYAYINAYDNIEYEQDEDGNDIVANEEWYNKWKIGGTIIDAFGNVYTKKSDDIVEQTTQKDAFGETEFPDLTKEDFLALKLKVPKEGGDRQCWTREDVWDESHTRRRASLKYQLSLNNIKSSTEFYPVYDNNGNFVTMTHEEATALSSATINRYIMNPYWFQLSPTTKLNDTYMFGYYEDKREDESDPLGYLRNADDLRELADVDNDQLHYNFSPGNILLVVPQKLKDEDVPHITLTVTDTKNPNMSAKLTINMLKMNITWESGYIYCYAIIDDLKPGDDKVQGPESITVVVNNKDYTDQW